MLLGSRLQHFSFLGELKVGGKGLGKPSNLVELTPEFIPILSSKPLKYRGLRRYRGLWNLHGQCGWKSFPTRYLGADRGLWNLQAPISAVGAIFGRKPRCFAHSRDACDGGAQGGSNILPCGQTRYWNQFLASNHLIEAVWRVTSAPSNCATYLSLNGQHVLLRHSAGELKVQGNLLVGHPTRDQSHRPLLTKGQTWWCKGLSGRGLG